MSRQPRQRRFRVESRHSGESNGTAAFIEEGVVRRELSDNYVYYTQDDYGASLHTAYDALFETLLLALSYLFTLPKIAQIL